MTVSRIIQSIVACVSLCGFAYGNNNFFLPGDAFFPTRLTEEDLGRLKADSKDGPVFEYSSLGGYDSAFCGYAGYQRAQFAQVDQRFIENLKRAYRRIRKNYERKTLIENDEDGKKSLEETNGIGVLFYPPDFDFPKYHLGLQYNEKWVEEVEKFGHSRQTIRLCCLVDNAEAVGRSWRDAGDVPALPAELPKVKLTAVPQTRKPVIVRGAVKAFVVDSRPLVKYFDPSEDGAEHVAVLSVDSTGISEISYEKDEWTTEPVEK